jgi:hypothetical protein
MLVHRGHHAFGVVRTGDGENRRVDFGNDAFLCAEAAGDDYFAVFGERLADRVERFLDGGVDEAARVDDDEVGVVVRGRGDITLRAQLREDALGVDESLRTA